MPDGTRTSIEVLALLMETVIGCGGRSGGSDVNAPPAATFAPTATQSPPVLTVHPAPCSSASPSRNDVACDPRKVLALWPPHHQHPKPRQKRVLDRSQPVRRRAAHHSALVAFDLEVHVRLPRRRLRLKQLQRAGLNASGLFGPISRQQLARRFKLRLQKGLCRFRRHETVWQCHLLFDELDVLRALGEAFD